MAVKTAAKRKSGRTEELNVGWQPGERVLHGLLLEAILKDNPIPLAYRMNYIANFYVGPLVAMMEKSFKLRRAGTKTVTLQLPAGAPSRIGVVARATDSANLSSRARVVLGH